MLAFLKSGQKDNSGYVDTADALEMLKRRFAHHIAYERKADSSKFLEHWVPAYISQVQLGVYCSILLSNSSVLQSKKKANSVEALRDILLSLSEVSFATIHACMAINRQHICYLHSTFFCEGTVLTLSLTLVCYYRCVTVL